MQTAKDIMTTHVVTISAFASVAEAMEVMKRKSLRDLMVEPSHADDTYGIVTETDVAYKVAAYEKNPQDLTVGEIMTRPCLEVDPDMTVQEVAQLFSYHHLHRAPVIREKLLGVVTVTDIMRETMWWLD